MVANGDLIVIIRFRNTKYLHQGKSLSRHASLFTDAALGIDIDVPTYPDGVKARLPAGTQTGSTFRVKGAGISDGESNGDLL